MCPTLCDPMDCNLPGSFVHGIFQARVLEWVAVSFSRGSSQSGDWTQVSRIAGRSFTVWATREDYNDHVTNCPEATVLLRVWFRRERVYPLPLWRSSVLTALRPEQGCTADSWVHWRAHYLVSMLNCITPGACAWRFWDWTRKHLYSILGYLGVRPGCLCRVGYLSCFAQLLRSLPEGDLDVGSPSSPGPPSRCIEW